MADARRDGRRRDEGLVPGAGAAAPVHHRDHRPGGRARFDQTLQPRARAARRRSLSRPNGQRLTKANLRERSLPAPRHIRFPDRPDARHRRSRTASLSTSPASRPRWSASVSAPVPPPAAPMQWQRHALRRRSCSEATLFTGYQRPRRESHVVGAGRRRARPAEHTPRLATDVEVFLAATPFYPEGGGQVGDRGEIVGPRGRIEVDRHAARRRAADRAPRPRRRRADQRSATGARRRSIREHRADDEAQPHRHAPAARRAAPGARQRTCGRRARLSRRTGCASTSRYSKPVTPEQLGEVESLVNEKVRQDVPVHTKETSFDEAMADGVLAFFGDKYGERVRVVEVNTVVPRFSAELCGGTHCERTGEIGVDHRHRRVVDRLRHAAHRSADGRGR